MQEALLITVKACNTQDEVQSSCLTTIAFALLDIAVVLDLTNKPDPSRDFP